VPRILDAEGNIAALTNRISLNGTERRIFEVGDWPEENYSVAFRFRLRSFPTNRMGQIFSAWAGPMDDPLRLTVENEKLSARIEAGGNYATVGNLVETGRWYEVHARKRGGQLVLTLDGKEQASCTVPEFVSTRARDFALGGNPHFGGNEFVEIDIENMRFRGN
jgi:hypothetical protein